MNLETRVGLFILLAIGTFLYLSVNIRALRLDADQYYTYKAYFEDTGGLALKAPVKIAGVDVGWVEQINLLNDGKAEVAMRVLRSMRLAKNAYAMIHQDGLIGMKTMDIDPGDSSTGLLMPGGTLALPGRTPASVGELLDQFKDIAATVQDVASSFKTVFASSQGQGQMRMALESITKASDRMADFSQILQRSMHDNAEHINTIIGDFKETMQSAKNAVPDIKNALTNNADKFGDASQRAGDAFETVQDASTHVREAFREAGQVVEKINNGKGTIGKLINEDETYSDVKKTIRGFKEYVGKTQGLTINVDMHAENMTRYNNNKGYFELRLRPNSDCFYIVQLTADQYGSISREEKHYVRRDDKGNLLAPSELNIPLERKIKYAETIEKTVRKKNDILFGLQLGKRFDRLALRIGLFENTFGMGLDYYVPLATDKVHWITSVEAFDMEGVNRLNDPRPHIKWLNKVFFLRNLYTSIGVDDIFSRHRASFFWGGGLRFGDDDLKYFAAYLPIGKTGGR